MQISPKSSSHNENESKRFYVLHPEHIDEAALWNTFRKGDERALITIFDRFAPVLYNYGVKISGDGPTTQDTIQELFIDLWRNAANLSETTSIKYYLFKSLRRKLIRANNKLERKLTVRLQPEHTGEAVPSSEFFLIDEQTSLEDKNRILALLNQLSRRQREAIFLRYFEELSYDKIADIMELTKQAVYNLISKAIDELKKNSGRPQ